MKRILLLFSCLACFFMAQAQTEEELAIIRRYTKKDREVALLNGLQTFYKYQDSIIPIILQRDNLPAEIIGEDGRWAEAHYFDSLNRKLIYISSDNIGAAIGTTTNQLHQGGALGLNLEGQNMKIGVFETSPIMLNHVEFGQRVIQKDLNVWSIALHNSYINSSEHATHVAGTIAASGIDANAKGMAPQAFVWGNTKQNEFEKMCLQAAGAQNGGLLISNHSYGIGDVCVNPPYYNINNINISMEELGHYGELAKTVDSICITYPWYLPVYSAGNSGNMLCTNATAKAGFDLLSGYKTAKNALIVGATKKFSVLPLIVHNDSITSFSNWGPTDDGRIKPDLCGVGQGLYSSVSSAMIMNAYDTKSGTSMASPNVAGSLLLVQQHYKNLNNGVYMPACLLKGLAIHTARECGGSLGPDYRFGWGLLDATRCVSTITDPENDDHLLFKVLESGKQDTFKIQYTGNPGSPLKATICWTDPPFVNLQAANLSNNYAVLINDLDLRIYNQDFSQTYDPWKFDPLQPLGSAAIKGDNLVDNVEQVVPVGANVGQYYYVVVTHKGSLQDGEQLYGIVISGGTLVNGACAAPNNLSANYNTPGNVAIQWNSGLVNVNYRVRYRPLNGPGWNYIITGVPSTVLPIQANTTYEVQVMSLCSAIDSSQYSLPFYVTSNLALSGIDQLEYWFDTDYLNKQTVNVSGLNFAANGLVLNSTLLGNGLHQVHLRVKAGTKWSCVTSALFLKSLGIVNQVRYWFDDNFVSAQVQPVNGTDWVDNLNTTGLANGLHRIHYSFGTSQGTWSSAESDLFMKYNTGANLIEKYRYWFGNNYANAVTVNMVPTALANIAPAILCPIVADTVADTLNIVFYNSQGRISSVIGTEFENRNVLLSPQNPDLLVSKLDTLNGQILLGVPNGIVFTIRNVGTASVGAHQSSLYLSNSSIGTANDILLGTQNHGSIPASDSLSNLNLPFTIPVGTPSGLYYLVLKADAGNVWQEPNEVNNIKSILIRVCPVLSIAASPASASTCAGGTTTLTASGFNTYTWSPAITNGAPFMPLVTTTYTVTASNASGCSATATRLVTVNPLPTVSVSASPTGSICQGLPVVLTASGANSYAWTGGVSNGLAFFPTATSTYTVTGTGANGCTKTATRTVTVLPKPPLVVTAIPSNAICFGGSLSLTASGGTTYAWTGGIVNGTSFSPAASTIYTVSTIGANGCTATVAQPVYVSNCGACPNDVVVSTSPYTVILTESATWIQTSGTVVVPSAGNVRLDANTTRYVLLQPGFRADYGSVFVAQPMNGCSAGAPQMPEPGMKQVISGESAVLVVYPNPTTGRLYVDHSKDVEWIEMYDVSGKCLIRVNGSGHIQTELDLSEYTAGIYYIRVKGFQPVKVLHY